MDVHSRYNQIPIFGPGRNRIAFMTDQANHQYNVMPFGLKNMGCDVPNDDE